MLNAAQDVLEKRGLSSGTLCSSIHLLWLVPSSDIHIAHIMGDEAANVLSISVFSSFFLLEFLDHYWTTLETPTFSSYITRRSIVINSYNSYITVSHLLFGPDRGSLGKNLARSCSASNSAMCESPLTWITCVGVDLF